MKKTNWKDIAELVGITAIVASLVFVGLQMQQEREIAEAQIYSEREDTAIELSRLINENGHVWIRGLQGLELSELEQLQFRSLARVFYLDRVYRYERAKRLGTGNPERIASFTAFYLYQYAGLRRAFDQQQERFLTMNQAFGYPVTTELTREVERILAELDANNPTLPVQDFMTF